MYYNHNLRTSLQEWKNRLYRSTFDQMGHQLKYLLNNLESNKITGSLLQQATLKYGYTDEQLKNVVNKHEYSRNRISFDNEEQHASLCYLLLKYVIRESKSYDLQRFTYFGGRDYEET